ncbi:MAG: hypothetical protein II547_01935, partial [Treponema sp.]|nr:hypothetical protein [Treponema sp.]
MQVEKDSIYNYFSRLCQYVFRKKIKFFFSEPCYGTLKKNECGSFCADRNVLGNREPLSFTIIAKSNIIGGMKKAILSPS